MPMITEKQREILQALANHGKTWCRASDVGGTAGSRHGGVLANLHALHLVQRRHIGSSAYYEYRINTDGTEALFDHARRTGAAS